MSRFVTRVRDEDDGVFQPEDAEFDPEVLIDETVTRRDRSYGDGTGGGTFRRTHNMIGGMPYEEFWIWHVQRRLAREDMRQRVKDQAARDRDNARRRARHAENREERNARRRERKRRKRDLEAHERGLEGCQSREKPQMGKSGVGGPK